MRRKLTTPLFLPLLDESYYHYESEQMDYRFDFGSSVRLRPWQSSESDHDYSSSFLDHPRVVQGRDYHSYEATT